MTTILLTAAGASAVVLLAEWLACKKAPVGYQDEAGFHFGSKPDHKEEWTGNPS